MNRPVPLRSPAAPLTVLAVLLGVLATVLAQAAPAKAVTVRGSFTLQGGSGSLTDPVLATGVATSAGCPAPSDPAQPYDHARLSLVSPDTPETTEIARTVVGAPLGDGAFTRDLDHRVVDGQPQSRSLRDAIRAFRPDGPFDGRYELRLLCRNATTTNETDYLSTMIEVTGETWAPIAQRATVLGLTTDPPVGVPGGQIRVVVSVEPKDAVGSVSFVTAVEEEIVEFAHADVVAGKAEAVLSDLAVTPPEGGFVGAVFTPADAEAFTPAVTADYYYVQEPTATPTPTPTTPTPTGSTPTPTPTDTTPTPTDDPTDDPTDGPTPTDTPGGSATPTPSATGTADASGGTDASGGSGSSGSGSSGSGGSGSGSSGGGDGGSGGTGPQGGAGGTLAATGASSAAAAALGALALCLLGAAAVIQVRRREAGARP
ncbi:LPXTG cell wall anchor domain-containing protein [Streptomyces hydrogenans]|uniref:LPXTG cell wall anchor domain-containing protein n=1 Tax=Streptomyces hydrogenans TaxID=1873719 RepID=UPI0033F2D5F1